MAANSRSRTAARAAAWLAIPGFLGVWTLLAGFSGPFGMTLAQPDLLLRSLHFGVCAVVAATATLAIRAGLAKVVRWPDWVVLALAATLATIPSTAVVRFSLGVFSIPGSADVGWAELALDTLAINLVLSFVAWRLFARERTASAPVGDVAGSGLSSLLPPEFRCACILSLQADDHYLRIQTDRGATLIHLSIGEAEALLAGEDGIRTHRSFWVARAAIGRVVRKAGRMTLEMRDGASVPVARARVPAVNAGLAGA